MEKIYHFTPRENGSNIDILVKLRSANNGTDIIWMCRNENNEYSIGYFNSWCSEKIASDRNAFLRFFCEHDCAGWSESAYETREKAAAALKDIKLPLCFTDTEILVI